MFHYSRCWKRYERIFEFDFPKGRLKVAFASYQAQVHINVVGEEALRPTKREERRLFTQRLRVQVHNTHWEKRKVLVQIPVYCQTSATSSQSTCLRVRWQLRNCRHHTQDNQDVLWTPTDSTYGNKCTKNTLWQSTINNSFHYICVIIIFCNMNHQYCSTICRIIDKRFYLRKVWSVFGISIEASEHFILKAT